MRFSKGDVARVVTSIFPSIIWVRRYKLAYLKNDITAGIASGITVIPQGMAYASIVGLPPIFGLYCALIPPLIYTIFGSSPQMIVGPTSVMSLLVGAGAKQDSDSEEEFMSKIFLLTLFSGLIGVALSITRAGFVANFLSHPVISGFTSAAAILISAEQLYGLFGFKKPLDTESAIYSVLWNFFKHIEEMNHWSLLMGLGSMIIILIMKRFSRLKLIPSALVVVTLGILISTFSHLENEGVRVVGDVPMGLPPLSIPHITFGRTKELLPRAFFITLIGFMEAYSIAKTFSLQQKPSPNINANQELLGLGMGNIIGSLFSCFPGTGSFSRTAVNAQVGAKTGASNVIAAAIVLLTILWLTPLFFHLPVSVLSAVIIAAVIPLFNYHEAIFLFKTKKMDLVVLLAAFFGCLFLGIEVGIAAALGLSTLMVLFRISKPKLHQEFYPDHGLVVLRMEESIIFVNISTLKNAVQQQLQQRKLEAIVIDFSLCNDIDGSAIHALKDLKEETKGFQTHLFFLHVKDAIRKTLRKGKIENVMSDEFFCDSLEEVKVVLLETPPLASSVSLQRITEISPLLDSHSIQSVN